MSTILIRSKNDLSSEIDKLVKHYSATTKNSAITQALFTHHALIEQVKRLDKEVFYLRSKLSDIAESYNSSVKATNTLADLLGSE